MLGRIGSEFWFPYVIVTGTVRQGVGKFNIAKDKSRKTEGKEDRRKEGQRTEDRRLKEGLNKKYSCFLVSASGRTSFGSGKRQGKETAYGQRRKTINRNRFLSVIHDWS